MADLKTEEKLRELVQAFAAKESFYTSAEYNETELRVHFLNPLFELLGWDVSNKKGLPSYSCEVRHEARVSVEESGSIKSKKPDYLFRLGSRKYFYLEAKKPAVNVLQSPSSAFQLRRYGWSGGLSISVLSNFRDLVIYDCSLKPEQSDSPQKCKVVSFHYTEYLERFDELRKWLSKQSAIEGSFDALAANAGDEANRIPFDAYFLDQIRKWRYQISVDLVQNGHVVDSEILNTHVQRVLNRILFLRLCEDHEYERFEQLKKVRTCSELNSLFSIANSRYDSGLFEIVGDDEPPISNDVLVDVLSDLYYPNGSYDFNVIDSSVISQIYDLFLCEEAEIVGDGVEIKLKDDLADYTGAVCTPAYIAEAITIETFASLQETNQNRNWRNVKLIDICCGSGIFLVFAFEKLIEKVVNQLAADGIETALAAGLLIQDGKSYKAGFSLKREILLDSIFGVDIDPVAAEICRLSLLIKLVEDATPEELEEYVRIHKSGILPDLSGNIKVGNSLVSGEYYSFNPLAIDDFELIKEIRPFDWGKEFSTPHFDAVLGNPPYVRVQNYVKNSFPEYEFVKRPGSEYVTALSGLSDKYYFFVEKGLSLLKSDGVFGCIVPNKFMSIKNGQPLRELLSTGGHVQKIIDFGSIHLFPGRSTYTCILVLGESPSASYYYANIIEPQLYFSGTSEFGSFAAEGLGVDSWLRPDSEIENIIAKNSGRLSELKDMASLFVGLQTSADKIYFIKPTSETADLVTFTDKAGKERSIEKGILRPALHDVSLRKYSRIKANEYLLFPYTVCDGKATLMSKELIEQNYPLAYSYLFEHKTELLERSNRQMTEDTWYMYGRSQSLAKFETGVGHLIWSVMSLGANYAYDDAATCFTGGGNGPYYGLMMNGSTKESVFYLQAVLNHPFVEAVLKQRSNFFGGGYYAHGKQYVDKLPIRRIDFDNAFEVDCHDAIVENVIRLRKLESEKANAVSSDQVELVERAEDLCMDAINRLIDTLYGIEEETDEAKS